MVEFVVSTLVDETVEDDSLSLREAAALANAQEGADQITFAPDLSGVLRLTQGAIELTDDLTISGGGLITITGDANGDDVLDADGLTDARNNTNRADNSLVLTLYAEIPDVALDGLTVTGGGI